MPRHRKIVEESDEEEEKKEEEVEEEGDEEEEHEEQVKRRRLSKETEHEEPHAPTQIVAPSTPSPKETTKETGPVKRMMITKMVLENFKSYAGVHEVGPFHRVT